MIRILCVCIHNSSRSQMAEAFLNNIGQGKVYAQSAGLTPGRLNPLVVSVMKEVGLDISNNRTKSVQEFIDRHESFDYVITVCDEASAERCPAFPGEAIRLHWGFEDPAALSGSEEEKLVKTRAIRDQIKHQVNDWVASIATR